MKFQFSLLLATAFVSGCAATHSLPPAQLQYGDSYLPPISVMTDDPFKGGEIRNSLRATGMFSDVISGQPPVDGYAVRVNVDQQFDRSPFPVVLLSAATLFLLPLSVDTDSQLKFTLMKGDKALQRYEYENQTRSYFWLLDRGGEAKDEHLRRITRAFARDVQQDALMRTEEVAQ